ncbi:acyltransferase [bacterium]|nr:acyltransferase [bacterium]
MIRKVLLRLGQLLAYNIPGAKSLRVRIHRLRGVSIGDDVFIGQHVHLDSAAPHRIHIGKNTQLSMNVVVVAHFRELGQNVNKEYSVYIDDDVFIGINVVILPDVKIGKGSVIATGSVVSTSIPEYTFAAGNPAVPKARVGKPLLAETSYADFIRNLKPII